LFHVRVPYAERLKQVLVDFLQLAFRLSKGKRQLNREEACY